METLKVCFVGLGSIARRHILNLILLSDLQGLELTVHALRHTSSSLLYPEIGKHISVIHHSVDTIRTMYDAVFVTNPSSLHYATIKELAPFTKSFFVEKPLFESADYDLAKLPLPPSTKCYIAAPMRFTEMIRYAKEHVKKHSPISVRIICSSFMPNWQVGRDYRESFRTKKHLGGGVDIDLIHEIDYMVDLFGFPKNAHRLAGHYSNLKMETCDLAVYLFEYEKMVAEVHLDYFGAVDKREMEVYSNNEVLAVDFINRHAQLSSIDKKKLFDKEYDHYFEEMKYFLDLLNDNCQNINTIEHAYKVLKLTKGVIT